MVAELLNDTSLIWYEERNDVMQLEGKKNGFASGEHSKVTLQIIH